MIELTGAPCAGDPLKWDLGVGSLVDWHRAIAECDACPLRAMCADNAKELVARGMAPRELIWAGVAYDATGSVVPNIDRYRIPRKGELPRIAVTRLGPRRSAARTSILRPAATKSRVIRMGERPSAEHASQNMVTVNAVSA